MMKASNSFKASQLACLILGFCCLLPNALAENSGATYAIDHYVMSSGGGTSSGGNYSIQATIAQVNTGTANGGAYQLQSGFWHEVPRSEEIFKNSFE